MSDRHPDIFTEAEAGEYLHLDPDETRETLEILRVQHFVRSFKVGRKKTMYTRQSLDRAIECCMKVGGGSLLEAVAANWRCKLDRDARTALNGVVIAIQNEEFEWTKLREHFRGA